MSGQFAEILKVADLAYRFALELGFCKSMSRLIRTGAFFHDVGKRYIPASILNKPSKLTPWEFEIVKQHTKYGYHILSGIPGELGELCKTIALYHHEQHDGKGYWGVPTADLPLAVGIVSICDIYIALTHKRCYKPPWPQGEALDYIEKNSGTQFCPGLASAFVRFIKKSQIYIVKS